MVLVIGSSTAAQAVATLYVANNGVDLAACGSTAQPCRSVNQAILLASDGDKIVVGPGRYTPTEEGTPGGCTCMINVNKRLTITSRDGASITVLDAQAISIDVVAITANNVVFGKKKKGFSLVNGSAGLSIATATTGVQVTGNQAGQNTGAGFELDGDDAVVTGNQAAANAFSGFSVRGTGHKLVGNLAAGNVPHGFAIFGSDHQLTGNLATDNSLGFSINTPATGNIHLTGSEAVGNSGPGIDIASGTTGVMTVNKGNIFGNDSGGANCGLSNSSGTTVDAKNNFWGAAAGPGVDPADKICGSGSATFTPVAIKEFKVKAP
jgi:hypothetical protein